MENDLNINHELDLTAEKSVDHENKPLPVNFITVGKVGLDDAKVYIKQNIYKTIESFSGKSTEEEVGGILMGCYNEQDGHYHVMISDFIEAKYTDSSASSLTFTHESWNHIHSEREKRCPHLKIIGWHHTHPDYGIFLSNYDMFIQHNFFNNPYQIAYVVDPVQKDCGFFQWKQGKVQPLNGFFIYDDVNIDITVPNGKKGIKRTFNRINLVSLLVAILSILFAITLLVKFSGLTTRLSLQRADLAMAEEQIANLQENSLYQEELIGSLNKEIDRLQLQGTVRLFKYSVGKGDTISAICAKFNIDDSYLNLIKSINDIENIDFIVEGQTILLPAGK